MVLALGEAKTNGMVVPRWIRLGRKPRLKSLEVIFLSWHGRSIFIKVYKKSRSSPTIFSVKLSCEFNMEQEKEIGLAGTVNYSYFLMKITVGFFKRKEDCPHRII